MSQFMQFLKYAIYLPLLVQLIASIRAAQATWRGAGTGQQKAAWVAEQFSVIVGLLESMSLVGKPAADALRRSSLAIITAIVEIMKDVQGEVPALAGVTAIAEPGGEQGDEPTATRAWNVGDELTTEPSKDDVRSGEDVYQFGRESRWMVRAHADTQKLPEPWRLVFTKK